MPPGFTQLHDDSDRHPLYNRNMTDAINSTELQSGTFVERRGKPRVRCSYPATVRCHLSGGGRLEARAVLANMSANGMYFRTQRYVQPGETVFILVRMSTTPFSHAKIPQLAASGNVVRVEPKPDGTYGVALQLINHRFI